MTIEQRVARRYLQGSDIEVDPDECPLQNHSHGGIPSGGGLPTLKEYSVGATQIAEALHCILGSLGRAYTGHEVHFESEIRHINEEIGIIKDAVEEYSRDIYVEQLNRNPDDPHVQELVDEIQDGSFSDLKRLARRRLQQLDDDLPDHIYEVARVCYKSLYALSYAFEKSLTWSEDKDDLIYPAYNAFTNIKFQDQLDALFDAIRTLKRQEGHDDLILSEE
jgi:hypothetical protein